ncbi:MAG: hypothetical protein A3G92_07935 [Deltaproteobacteria bacterium RIFCSPLOWO2_12_FULL_38_8]|nr:MAG: hypothetical protein A3G92_07935 [Deltaproteobacteria bacterium RIFCSPLOWO2_12_FULL_38_8]
MPKIKYIFLGLTLIFLLFFLIKIYFFKSPLEPLVSSTPPSATIVRLIGSENFIELENAKIPLFIGAPIDVGQKIIVGPHSLVELLCDEMEPSGKKTSLIIYENSSYILTETFLNQKNTFLATLLSGWIKVATQHLSSSDRHEIRTQNTVIGVRGTTYYLQYLSEKITTLLHVIETSSDKKVVISSKGKKEIEVPAGTTATVIKDEAPILKPLNTTLLPQEIKPEPEIKSDSFTPTKIPDKKLEHSQEFSEQKKREEETSKKSKKRSPYDGLPCPGDNVPHYSKIGCIP